MPEYAPKAPTVQPTAERTRVGPRPPSSDVEASSSTGLDSQAELNGDDGVRDLAQLRHRLNRSPRVARLTQLSKQLRKTSAVRETIQRKVGFEFEAIAGWHVYGRNRDKGKWEEIKHTKQLLLMGPNGLGGLSSDNGKAEWVSRPLTTWDEVALAHVDFQELLSRIASSGTLKLAGEEQAFASTQSQYAQHKFTGARDGVRTKAQATLGVAAGSIPDLFEKLIALASSSPKRRDKLAEAAKGVANREVTFGMPEALAGGPAVISKSSARSGLTPDGNTAREAAGFVMILLKTITDARHRPAADEDPKYAFPMMPRTDFGSMLASLENTTQGVLGTLWADGNLGPEIAAAIGCPLDVPLFVRGYRQLDKTHTPGPTIQEWLASVFEGGGRKDLLSPPPGFPRHVYDDQTKQPEGLGAMGPDPDNQKLLLFELRQVTEQEICTNEDWLAIMAAFAKTTGIVTGDRALIPPESSRKR